MVRIPSSIPHNDDLEAYMDDSKQSFLRIFDHLLLLPLLFPRDILEFKSLQILNLCIGDLAGGHHEDACLRNERVVRRIVWNLRYSERSYQK